MESLKTNDQFNFSYYLSKLAVQSLIEEAELTPKPGLVDLDNNGAHTDLTIDVMVKSAKSLGETFNKMALVSYQQQPSQMIREEIASIGRFGESIMFQTTNGVNTHKGAIWAVGLLVSSAAMQKTASIKAITSAAGEIARYPDRNYVPIYTNGKRVSEKYGVQGAKGEAEQGFPHITKISLPMLEESRRHGEAEHVARLNALVALMANVDDTCILHRGGAEALAFTKKQAKEILQCGGVSTCKGWELLLQLDQTLIQMNVSPGGSADLLAATLFIDSVTRNDKVRNHGISESLQKVSI